MEPRSAVCLDCSGGVGLSRARARIDAPSGAREGRFELESIRFHERVRAGYLSLAAASPERFVVVDGSGDVARTEKLVTAALTGRIPAGIPASGAAAKAS